MYFLCVFFIIIIILRNLYHLSGNICGICYKKVLESKYLKGLFTIVLMGGFPKCLILKEYVRHEFKYRRKLKSLKKNLKK